MNSFASRAMLLMEYQAHRRLMCSVHRSWKDARVNGFPSAAQHFKELYSIHRYNARRLRRQIRRENWKGWREE